MRTIAWPVGFRRGQPAAGPLYAQLCEVETLTRAWQQVRRGGGAGVDGQSVALFERRWAQNMAELAAELRERRYHPLPLRKYLMPRADGAPRPISLLALRDRVVQRATLDCVRPLFERQLSPAAFGCLPGRGVGDALARAEHARQGGLPWIVRTDIHAFFETVDHARVRGAFHRITRDGALTALVDEWLAVGVLRPEAPAPAPPDRRASWAAVNVATQVQHAALLAQLLAQTWSGPTPERVRASAVAAVGRLANRVGRRRPSGQSLAAVGLGALTLAATGAIAARRTRAPEELQRGTPQGSPLSPLLATAVLDPLDRALDRPGRVLVRYVDDILVLCRDEAAAQQALADAQRQLARLGLELNPNKTVVQPYDAGFTYLGAALPQLRPEPPSMVRTIADAFRSTGYWRTRRLMRARRSIRVARRVARRAVRRTAS